MHPLRRLLIYVAPYRRAAALSLLCLTALVLFDLALPQLIERVIDGGIARRDASVLARTAALMLASSALSALFALANNALSVRVGEGFARDLRDALFVAVQRWSYGDLDRVRTGELLVRLTSDVAALKMLVQVSLRIGTRAPLLMLGSVALMFRTAPSLALTMVPLLVVTSALMAWFVARMDPLFRAVQERLDALNTAVQETIAGARLVRAFVRDAHETKRFEEANAALTARSVRVMALASAMTPALTLCVNLGMVLVVASGGRQAMRGALTIGQVVAFSNYLLTTMQPLLLMTMLASTWAAGMASARRLVAVLDVVPEVQDAPDAPPLPPDAPGRVTWNDVSFTWRGEGNQPAVQHATLALEPGQTVALLGPTGAGKSTLASLVPRFYDATEGAVMVGDHDVRTRTQASLRGAVGIVPQEATLFAGTIRDNLRYARPDASDDDMVAAARMADADGFIRALPAGYDAPVMPRGANLSGGQRQRIALARTLLMAPRVLILDDSTSAVDTETEARIHDALRTRPSRGATLLIAQRVSTVLQADLIAVLDHGRIVARGTHHALMATSADYREIWSSQLGDGPGDEP